jgi:hypothetical protein
MTISESKILSHTGVEYNKSVKQNNLQVTNTINVKPTIPQREVSTFSAPEVKAEYPKILSSEPKSSVDPVSPPPPSHPTAPSDLKIKSEQISDAESPELLKALLQLYSSNILLINGDLILKNEELISIVKLATDADDVIIELDFEVFCCGTDKGLHFLKRINCVHDEVVADFRFKYNIQFNILRKYKTSLDITHD